MSELPAHGYDAETAAKYTEGQRQFFDIDKVLDGATVAMEAEISALAKKYVIHTICDIGCGSNCGYLQKWKNAAKAQKLTGVEPSPHMRSVLEDGLARAGSDENIDVVSGGWGSLPFASETVDLAVSRFSLHHLKDITEGYAELARILRSDGHAVISLPHPEYCKEELQKKGIVAQEGIPMSVEVFDTTLHYYYHEIEAYLGENLAECGLELVKTESFNWGTSDEAEQKTPNTLLIVVRKK